MTNLFGVFEQSKNKYPNKTALVVDKIEYSYTELYQNALQLAHLLKNCEGNQIGIFAGRSFSAYVGILGTLACGKTYVPLNTQFSAFRNQLILELAQIKTLIVDALGLQQIQNQPEGFPKDLVLVCPEMDLTAIPKELENKFKIHTKPDLTTGLKKAIMASEGSIAYIIFTSGSTGIPKGVPVSHKNVWSYINYLSKRYDLGPEDRFSQVSDLTFDASVHDMYLCWYVGATLYPIPEKVLMAPAKFIKENKLTTWFSIPSLLLFMKRFKMLKPNSFPSIRYSLFGGESLPKSLALEWQEAAPNSIIENQYGATEITIGLSHYRLPKQEHEIQTHNGIVSLGQIFTTQEYRLIDENNQVVETEGEICLTGSQITKGYWQNPERTEENYFKFPGDDRIWYKTGDILRLKEGNLFYIARKDFQVKVRGFRIELEEINLAVKTFTGADLVYTIPYPVTNGLADHLYCFVEETTNPSKNDILQHLRKKLTSYMVPKEIIFIKEFPLNPNGKIDSKQLIDLIQ
ncbi:MAG: AMP-binding protein [Aequorivita sp.]